MKSGKQKRAALRSRSSKISGGEGRNRTSQVQAVHHAQSSFRNGLPPLEPVTIPAIIVLTMVPLPSVKQKNKNITAKVRRGSPCMQAVNVNCTDESTATEYHMERDAS